MLSNIDIEELCKKLNLPIVGVFSKDMMPDHHYIGSYYINMQDYDDGNGTHWVYCRIFDDGSAIYFDSYGFKCPMELQHFLKPFKPYAINNRQIQSLESTNCGLYCIACDVFFQYDSNKKMCIFENYDDFLNMWSKDPHKNDKILKEYLKKN